LKKTKVCVVTGQYPPQLGGVGNSAYRVTNLLAEAGSAVHVVAFQKWGQPVAFDESVTATDEQGVLIHRVKVFYADRQMDDSVTESEVLTRYNREMFQALDYFQRRYGYDLLHAFFLYPAGFIAGLVAKLHSVKMVASIRGNDVGKYAFDPLRLPFISSALKNADFVTSVATNLIEQADRTITPVLDKAQTILNSIAPARLQVRTRPDLPLQGFVIGTSGLFRYKKGLYYLIKALGSLKDRFEFTLLLLGDFFKPEDEPAHLKFISDHGLDKRTVITGKIPNDAMADYLQLFDLLVFPSLYSEGCPLSMLEGMALAKPVIASATGAIPEIIRDRENGLLVDPGSSEQIAAAIVELLEDKDFRHSLAKRAGETVAGMTPEQERRSWLGVYEKLGVL